MSLLLAALLVWTLAFPATAAGGAVFEVRVPRTLPRADDVFTVEVALTGNPGFAAAQFTLAYDKAKLTCLRADLGELLRGTVSVTNPDASDGALIAGATLTPVTADGVLGEFVFRAKTDLDELDLTLRDVVFEDMERMSPQYSTRTVTVAEAAVAPNPTVTAQPGTSSLGDMSELVDGAAAQPIFRDTADHWGAKWIERAVARQLFNGYPDGTFQPDKEISRAEFVTVLWRMAGSPEPTLAASFADVPADVWYAEAVAWAKESGCVNGRTPTAFEPQATLQRQEAMKIIYNYASGVPGTELMFTQTYDAEFADSAEIASWGRPAMYWAYYRGLISGVGGSRLDPRGSMTRAMVAKVLINYLDKFES